MPAYAIAFNRPETECRMSSAERPIDFDHLARQTMGQKDLEAEVLRLFLRQARDCVRSIHASKGNDRVGIAHTLKGSARGIGAFNVADQAARLEEMPDDAERVEALCEAVVAVENFLLRLSR